MRSEALGDVQRRSETFRGAWRHSETFRDVQRRSETFRGAWRHSETFRDVQETLGDILISGYSTHLRLHER